MSDRLDLATFQPHVGDTFVVETGTGTVELTLTDASAGPWQPQGETAFAFELMFGGPSEPVLPQATYRMTHPGVGDFEIFIVPLKNEGGVTTYQAVFS